LETSKTIKDAFGSYAIKKIPKVQKANWQGEGLETSLAKVEGDVAAERVFKVAFDETYKEPQVVYDRFNIRAILAHSESFQDEEGYLTLVLRNPFTAESVDNWVYSSLLQQIVEEQNQAFQESERINSGAIISTTMDTFGNTTFTVYGKSQHHKRILLTLLKRFKALAITERELANSQLGMRNFFNNLDSYSARQQLSFYRSEISETFQIFNRDDILNALSDVDIDSLLETHKVISQDSFVDIFAMGNYGKENLVALVDEVKTLFPEREGIQNWRFESPFSVNPSQQLSYNIDMLQKGIAIADIYISPEKSASLAAQVYVLSFMMSEPFHSSLRTEQQLGYAVSLWTSPLHDYPAITFRIESNSASLPELKERIANFIADYRETLESYNEDDLAQLRQAIIADAFRAPNSLLEEVDSLLSDWAQDNLNFDTIDKTQQVIGRVTKQDLLALYDKLFSSESANFMVQLKGIDYIDSEFFD
jgi:protease-3